MTARFACSLLVLSLPSPLRAALRASKSAPGKFVDHPDISPDKGAKTTGSWFYWQ
jgi:hypothetical protein